ncbi:hypothetical protein T12_10473, partial [Trichinella patagoniensis]
LTAEAALPEDQTTPAPPFAHVVMDFTAPPQPIREADEEGHITQTDNFRSFQSVASEQRQPGLSGMALDLNCCYQARCQAAGAGASTHQ